MYSSTVEFRLELVGTRSDGRQVNVTPTLLAARLPSSARPFLMGADHFRRVGDVSVLKHHLDDLARLCCADGPSFERVEVTLVERRDAIAATTRTIARQGCRR